MGVRLAFTIAAGVVALASFAGVIVQVGGVQLVGSGRPVVAAVSQEQIERTAELARRVAGSGTVVPASTAVSAEARLGTAYDELRRQMSYCSADGPSMVVERVRPGAYDAVFALGAGVLGDPHERATGWVGDDRRTRALAGYLAVVHFGAAPVLGFAGGTTDGPGTPSEAASMRQFVQSAPFQRAYAGLGKSPIRGFVLEERSTSTVENVAEIAALAKNSGWRRVLIVTSQYHVPRASRIVQQRGLAADVIPAEAVVDGALQDGALHESVCAYYRGPVVAQAIQREIVALADLLARAQP